MKIYLLEKLLANNFFRQDDGSGVMKYIGLLNFLDLAVKFFIDI